MDCVMNHRIECPGHDSDECCLNCEDVYADHECHTIFGATCDICGKLNECPTTP